MRPVVTPTEMAAIDAAAPESLEVLIDRVGWHTAQAAKKLIHAGTGARSLYGKRIAVFVGKGNNGADGRSAATYLDRVGARCTIFEHGSMAQSDHRITLPFDLVIDACYGTGLRGEFDRDSLPFPVGNLPVLAVDIPSGVDGLTGQLRGQPLQATATVTFASLKPGLLLEPGRSYTGSITVADIGLDCSRATVQHLGTQDVAGLWPRRDTTAHKWNQAVYVVGGSPGLTGAPSLSAAGALRAGAGYVACSIPAANDVDTDGAQLLPSGPIEAVTYPVAAAWAETVLERIERFGAAVVGPGLTTDPDQITHYLANTTTPTVFDAGAIDGLAHTLRSDPEALQSTGEVLHVITPHDGEYKRLLGELPGPDRIAAARQGAAQLGAVLLVKGPTTIVAHPDGRVLLSSAADQRLATAGTGDVLAGVIAAGIAGGLDPFHAAGVGAELHGLAGSRGHRVGLTAGDLPLLIAEALSVLV